MRPRVLWLAALGYGAILVWGSRGEFPERLLTGSPMPHLADKPIGEDGYYMLTVAWRLGTGLGFTYNTDGATTGVQPLVTVLAAGLARIVAGAGGDRWTFARAMLAFGTVQWLLMAAAIGAVASRLVAGEDRNGRCEVRTAATILTLFNYAAFRMSTYGLETAALVMLCAACVALTIKGITTGREAITFGAVSGLGALTRIDFLVVVAVYLGLRWLSGSLRGRLASAAGGTALLIAAPWLIRVYVLTGSVLPSSGRAQYAPALTASTLLDRSQAMLSAVTQWVSPWMYLPAAELGGASLLGAGAGPLVVTLALLVSGMGLAVRGWRSLPAAVRSTVACWGAAMGVLLLVYALAFWPAFFFTRYAAPLAAITIPLIAFGLYRTVPVLHYRLAIPAVMMATFSVTAWGTLHTGRVGNAHSLSAGYVARQLPSPAATVGAFQSGVVGYFNDRVINLDGKVNARALDAQVRGVLGAYLDQRGITHIVDWPGVIEMHFSRSGLTVWPECPGPPPGQSICIARPIP